MYKGFNLDLDKEFFSNSNGSFQRYRSIGEKHLMDYKAHCETQLQKFIVSERTIDGTKLQKNWFPQIDVDVFISHSHIDEDLALALAGWINKTFGLKCFVDSAVWGYVNNLLRNLNDNYSHKRKNDRGGYLYSYELCNKVSQHVYMMLNVALQKMIDNTEVIFVLNTNNFTSQFINDDEKISATYSPFIYAELACIETIRLKSKKEYRRELRHSIESMQENLRIRYEIGSLQSLERIDKETLSQWKKAHLICNNMSSNLFLVPHPLDALYEYIDNLES